MPDRTLTSGRSSSRAVLTRRGCRWAASEPPAPFRTTCDRWACRRSRWAPSLRAAYPAASAKLARRLRRYGTEIVQTHLVDGSLVGLTAARMARSPVAVMTAHHSHELPFHGRRLVWPERLCTGPLCDHVIAPSQDVRGTLDLLAHVPRQKIEVVHHGFDLDHLNPRNADSSRVRRELGLEGKLVFGAIGRLFALKNYPALLTAFAAALAEVREARLLIVGKGDMGPLTKQAQSWDR